MENPFNKLTTLSVMRPKATIASILVITLALSIDGTIHQVRQQ